MSEPVENPHLSSRESSDALTSGSPKQDLDTYISDMIRDTFGGDVATNDTSAPVILPDRKDLAVRLVTLQSLERLHDAESDTALYDNLLWCLLGGLIGFFTNVVTGTVKITTAGYVFLAAIIVAAIASIMIRRRFSRRLAEVRGRVYREHDQSKP